MGDADNIVQQHRAELEQVKAALLEGGELAQVAPEAIARDIARRILEAPDDAAIRKLQETVHAEDRLDTVIEVRGVRWNPSDFEEGGPKVYALIEAVNMETGETETITCGSVNVMAYLLRSQLRGELPKRGSIREAERKTRSGYSPQWFYPEDVQVEPA